MAAVAILKFSNSEQKIKIPRIMIYTLITVVVGQQNLMQPFILP